MPRINCCAGLLVCAGAILPPTEVVAIQPDTLLYERLFTDCSRVAVLVDVEDDARSLELAEPKRLQTMAESRLRAARLYEPEAPFPSLDIVVEAVAGDTASIYHLSVKLVRSMRNPLTDRTVSVVTWRRGMYGSFTNRAVPSDSVSADASDMIDELIRDYLRVNEASCE